MKKILMTALMCLMVSSTCLANGVAGIFSIEESLGDKLVDSLVGKGNYSVISPLLTDSLRGNLSLENYRDIRKNLDTSFGKLSRFELIGFNRINDVNTGRNSMDSMGYILHSANGRHLLLRIVMVNERGIYKIGSFELNEVALKNLSNE